MSLISSRMGSRLESFFSLWGWDLSATVVSNVALLCNSAVPFASPAAIGILPSVDHLVRNNGVYF